MKVKEFCEEEITMLTEDVNNFKGLGKMTEELTAVCQVLKATLTLLKCADAVVCIQLKSDATYIEKYHVYEAYEQAKKDCGLE